MIGARSSPGALSMFLILPRKAWELSGEAPPRSNWTSSINVRDHSDRAIFSALPKLDRRQEFLSRFKIRSEYTKHAARHHGHIRSMNTARGHAFVRAFNHDGNAGRLEHR